jgi:hypothetical protein
MKLIFLCGPPAVGKLTVAQALAIKTGYKLFHNHLSADLVSSIFEFGSLNWLKLLEKIRLDVFEAVCEAELDGLIFTYMYLGKPGSWFFIADIRELLEQYDGELCVVGLVCSDEQLEKRVVEPSRKAFGKIDSVEKLRGVFPSSDLTFEIPCEEVLVIDNTELPPEQAADRIIEHFRLQPQNKCSETGDTPIII